MNSFRKKMVAAGAVLAALSIIACLLSIKPARTLAVSMTVAGFVTNRYTAFDGEYICAVVCVTNNSSRSTFYCRPAMSGYQHLGPLYGNVGNASGVTVKTSKNYYAYRDGDFEMRTLPPHSGFAFEAFVLERSMTNDISLSVILTRSTTWLGGHLPSGVNDKLPALFVGDRKFKTFTVTVAGFTERPLP